MSEPPFHCKVILTGHTAVGKTSISHFFAHGAPPDITNITMGAAYSQHIVEYQNHQINFELWDTAGSERFRSMMSMFFRSAKVAVLVFSVDDPGSFSELEYWVDEVSKHCLPNTIRVLVANKIDLLNPALFDINKAKAYAESIGATYAETSALTGEGITTLFATISQLVVEAYLAPKVSVQLSFSKAKGGGQQVNVDGGAKPTSGGCCSGS